MKYIKKFNEELKPDTYINAGEILKKMPGGGKRSSPLIDYGSEKKFGFYKMHWANNSTVIAKDSTFTNLVCDSYFGRPDSSVAETFSYSAEDVVESWENGGALCMTFNFSFRATEETKDKFTDISEIMGNLPMFSFEIWFSDWEEGLEVYNETEEESDVDNDVDLNTMYKWTNTLSIYMKKPVRRYYSRPYSYFGIFSDRISALKFKKQLNDLLEPHKEKVMELLSCVNAPAADFEQFEDKINKIRVNSLFSTAIDKKSQSNWFNYIPF